VGFKYTKNGKIMKWDAFFSNPKCPDHLKRWKCTFSLPYLRPAANGYPAPGLKNIGNKDLDKLMGDNFQNIVDRYNASGRKTALSNSKYKCISNGSINVRAIEIKSASSNCFLPMPIVIEGITSSNAPVHFLQYNPDARCLTTVMPGAQADVIYNNDESVDVNIHAIHGVHNIEGLDDGDLSIWGTVEDKYVSVSMENAGMFTWLMYNLVFLVQGFIAEGGEANDKNAALKDKLPPYINSECWQRIQEFQNKRKNNIPNIYAQETALADNYIGRLMNVIYTHDPESKRANQLMWEVAPDKDEYRIPFNLMRFIHKKYIDSVKYIKLAQPDKIKLKSLFVAPEGMEEQIKEDSRIFFNAEALLHVPKVHVIMKPDVTNNTQ
jgi:hypothetical protein